MNHAIKGDEQVGNHKRGIFAMRAGVVKVSSSVPEPSTLALVGSGIAGLLAFCRRNK